MRKLYVPIIAAFIVAAFFIVSGPKSASYATHPFLGDADALGSADDANASYTYELMMLQDPATGKIPAHIRERELLFAANLPTDKYNTARTTSAANTWQPRGPWNVGGRTRALAIDVSNENNLIAGSCSGGMWRSTDRGLSWHPTTAVNEYKSTSCVAQDTRSGHTNVWYYGTGEAYGASATATGAYYLGNGIYKSTDGGVTWDTLHATRGPSLTTFDSWGDIIWNIVTDSHDTVNDVVYAASNAAIYRSADGGVSWTAVLVSNGATASYFTDVAISKSGVVYATLSTDGPSPGLYRSTDGITFKNITPSGFPTSYNRVKIGISPSDENQVYFLGNTPGFGYPDTNYVGTIEWNSLWRYTYLSGDGSGTGGKWQDRSLNLPSTGGLFDKFTCQGSYDLVVKVKPNDTNVVFIGGTNLYRSNSAFADNAHTAYIGGYQEGATLPVVNMYLNHHPDQHELAFFSDPNKMLSSNDGGIFYTNDNTVPTMLWTSLNNGYMNTMFYSCAIDHASESNIVIGGAQDNGSWFTNSTNLTTPWVTPRGGDGSFCAIADNSKAYYFSIQDGKIMKGRLDNLGNVDSFARIDPIGGRGYLFVNPFILDPNNNDIMYMAGGKFLWRNNDLSGIPYASNWDSISTNWFRFPDSTFTFGATITAIAVSKTPANRVYIGTSNRRVFRLDSANVVTHKPKDITSTLFPTAGGNASANVSCIAVDPTNADHILVAYSNYGVYSMFYSADGGTTFHKAAGNLEDKNNGTGDGPSIRWVSIIPVSGGSVYLAGTSVGLFATTQLNDTATVWVQQGANTIGADVVDMIDYRSTDGLVVVATHSGGIFSSYISQAGSITEVKNVAPAHQDLEFTNYPNPFTTQTTFQFNLKTASKVSLEVFDLMGRPVQTLADGMMDAGEKQYVFSSNNLPSGLYVCVLRAGDNTETIKLMKQ